MAVSATALLLAVAVLANAAPRSTDPHLSATVVGRLEPGAQGHLAVRWDGEPGALLDAWVDLDGNGVPGPGELVVEGRPLAPGIEVVGFELPVGVRTASKPKVWVRSRTACCGATETLDLCAWQAAFGLPDLEAPARAIVVFDDGTGPALYVGGQFAAAGGVGVNRIARWDGSTWSALAGPSNVGVGEGEVYALAVFDDGSGPALYAGGWFTLAGGVTTNNIARWDGTAWSALSGPSGTGTDASVRALTVFDDGSGPALFAGGVFTTAGGVTVNKVARWSGSGWSALSGPSGTGTSGWVRALAVFDDGSGPALYAGGSFATAGGVSVNRIARWDGSSWSAITGPNGTGTSGMVYALSAFDDGSGPALFVGGDFTSAGGVTVNSIASWDGSSWSAITGPNGTGTSGTVYALSAFDDGSGPALFVGGDFTSAGGVTVNSIASWDGSSWSAITGPNGTGTSGTVYALSTFDNGSGPALYAGGSFATAGGVSVNRIARWDGSSWSALGGSLPGGVDRSVRALAVYDDGQGPALYAGGRFLIASGLSVNHIARWNGLSWSPLSGPSGVGVNGDVYALTVYDDGSGPALYAGGLFTSAGGVTVNGIARWNGSQWSALTGPGGTGVSDHVSTLAVLDDGTGPALFAGGGFDTAGGVTAHGIARWNGSEWSALSGPGATGMTGLVSALAAFDDGSGPALYAGGWFDTAGGVPVNRIARWNGTEWSALTGPAGTGVREGDVAALAIFDDGSGPALYAGGSFDTAGGVPVNRIARWNGTEWSALTGPAGTGTSGRVSALAFFDDGAGPSLYAGGFFLTAGGVTVHHVARWDGEGWSALAGSYHVGVGGEFVYSYVNAFGTHELGTGPTLFVGGEFAFAGGVYSNNLAAWGCRPTDIFADGFELGDASAWTLTAP